MTFGTEQVVPPGALDPWALGPWDGGWPKVSEIRRPRVNLLHIQRSRRRQGGVKPNVQLPSYRQRFNRLGQRWIGERRQSTDSDNNEWWIAGGFISFCCFRPSCLPQVWSLHRLLFVHGGGPQSAWVDDDDELHGWGLIKPEFLFQLQFQLQQYRRFGQCISPPGGIMSLPAPLAFRIRTNARSSPGDGLGARDRVNVTVSS